MDLLALSLPNEKNNTKITDLPKDLLINCCHYLHREDIYNFSQVNKYFNSIGMNPIALSQLSLYRHSVNSHAFMTAINQYRYSCIKGLDLTFSSDLFFEHRFEQTINLKIPQQLSKQLKVLHLYGPWCRVIHHPFKSLEEISLHTIHPMILFHKIDDYDKLKLKHIGMDRCLFDIPVFKCLIKCRNLETLRIKNVVLNGGDVQHFQAEADSIINVYKQNKDLVSAMKSIVFDIPAMIFFKSFLYHTLSTSKVPILNIESVQCNPENLSELAAELFSLNDYQNKSEIKTIFSKLKGLYLTTHNYAVNMDWFSIAKNIGMCLDMDEITHKLEMFHVVIEHNWSLVPDLMERYPINSTNVWEIFDPIVSNSINSRLEITLWNPILTEHFIMQLLVDNNKTCFKEIVVNDEFWNNRYVHDLLRDEYIAKGSKFDKDEWGQKVAHFLWNARLKSWSQVVNSASVAKIRKLDITVTGTIIDIDHFIQDLYENEGIDVSDGLNDALSSLEKYIQDKLSQYTAVKFVSSFDSIKLRNY
eukprot:470015_1